MTPQANITNLRVLCFIITGLFAGCAARSPNVIEPPRAALPQHIPAADAALHEPAGVTLPQGNCKEGFFLSGDARCVPLAWYCAPLYYNAGPDDGCDCNCGAPDPDCDNPQALKWCYKLGQSSVVSSCQACE